MRGARRRRGRRSRSPAAWPRSPPRCSRWSERASTSSSPTTAIAARASSAAVRWRSSASRYTIVETGDDAALEEAVTPRHPRADQRVADQPLQQARRPRSRRRHRPAPSLADDHRLDLRDADQPAPDRARHRSRPALRDQVPRRPQRRARRRDPRSKRTMVDAIRAVPGRPRRHPRSTRRLPPDPRSEDACAARRAAEPAAHSVSPRCSRSPSARRAGALLAACRATPATRSRAGR